MIAWREVTTDPIRSLRPQRGYYKAQFQFPEGSCPCVRLRPLLCALQSTARSRAARYTKLQWELPTVPKLTEVGGNLAQSRNSREGRTCSTRMPESEMRPPGAVYPARRGARSSSGAPQDVGHYDVKLAGAPAASGASSGSGPCPQDRKTLLLASLKPDCVAPARRGVCRMLFTAPIQKVQTIAHVCMSVHVQQVFGYTATANNNTSLRGFISRLQHYAVGHHLCTAQTLDWCFHWHHGQGRQPIQKRRALWHPVLSSQGIQETRISGHIEMGKLCINPCVL